MTKATIKELRPGSFVILDDAPCKVERVQISVSGKHGTAKARLEASGLLDERRRSIVAPADEELDVPMILKKKAQILSVSGNKAQIMDMETYEVFELDVPEDMKNIVTAGTEMLYFEVGGIRTLKQLK
jgi:translation initiation factor 5A